MDPLRKATFAPLLNQTFTVRLGDGRRIPLRLATIDDREMDRHYESFTLNFDPPDGAAALPDGTYLLENDRLGEAMIFLSPTPAPGPAPGRYYYEAVFNVYLGDGGQ